MLVLSRFRDESIVITASNGQRITVTLVDVRSHGRKAKIGFEAPPDVTIHRKEIQDSIDAEERAA